MYFSTKSLGVFLLLAAASTQAFTPNVALSTRQTGFRPCSVVVLKSSAEDEIAALRAAAAKAREEANRLSEELGKPIDDTAASTAVIPSKSKEEFQAMLPSLLEESDVSKQAAQWEELQQSNTVTAFGKANLKTFPVALNMLEQRTGLTADSLGLSGDMMDAAGKVVSLDDFKYATLYVLGFSAVSGVLSLALLPPNVGATLCYFFALLPVVFLGIGSSAPQFIANAIASFKSSEDDDNAPSAEDRICRHEAAHFCCGYWCGLPVAGYDTAADSLVGTPRVEFDVAPAGDRGGLTSTQVAALTVTALAGSVGEALEFTTARGAAQDLQYLETNVFRKSEEFVGAQAQQDLTRWGCFTATQLLRTNADKYEDVVKAFGRQASVKECVEILEN